MGTAASGVVWLEMASDGGARYGLATYRWRVEGDHLLLERAGARLRLQITAAASGFILTGPPFGRVVFTAAPLPKMTPAARPVRPRAWRGRWVHRASGGHLELSLDADGRYAMVHRAGKGDAQTTVGRWHADRGLVLTPNGGASQRYRVQIDGGELVLSGGDLPLAVRFRSAAAL